MSYRPDGWRKNKDKLLVAQLHSYPKAPYVLLGGVYEAGADALLQGLKKEAIHIGTVEGWKYLRDSYEDWLYGNRVGYLVFIEED